MRSAREGFALLTVLWAIVALGMVAGVSAGLARRGQYLTQNRIALTRAAWAREACIAVLQARYTHDPAIMGLDSIDLGRGTWCRIRLEDPSAQLNINLADERLLRAALRDPALIDGLLDWRDDDDVPRPEGAERDWYLARRRIPPRNSSLADTAELRMVRGFELMPLETFTTRGDGRVNPNLAQSAIAAAIPGMNELAVAALNLRRASHRPVASVEELISLAPPSVQLEMQGAFQDLQAVTTFAPTGLIAFAEGRVGSRLPSSLATLTLVPLAGRLAVIAREGE